MPENSYISTNVEEGKVFDTLVGNLLAFRPEEWGWSEQDYTKISEQFSVASNDLYYLPSGNYRIINIDVSLLPKELNITTIEAVNISLIEKEDNPGTKYLYFYLNHHIYSATLTQAGQSPIEWTDITDIGEDGKNTIIHIDNNQPTISDSNTHFWIDTSNSSTNKSVVLKYYNNGTWISYKSDKTLQSSVYDPTGKRKDPFIEVMTQLEKLVGDYTNFIKHKNNELALIHITNEEREKYNLIISRDDLNKIFGEGGAIYNQIVTFIEENTREQFKTDSYTSKVNELETKLDEHLRNHIDDSKITSWDNKANKNHTHNLDGKVTINGSDIVGDIKFNSSDLPNNVKERVVTVASEEERLALTIDTVQNGDTVCVDNNSDNPIWYKVIDDSKLGQSKIDFWNEATNGLFTQSWESICYGNGKFVAIASSNSRTFAYSMDGINWTETTNGLSTHRWASVCYGNGKFVAISGTSTYNDDTFAYSTDGINWTETTNGLSSKAWSSICYGNDKFVVVASQTSRTFAYSTDGINWTETSNGLNNFGWESICYGNGKFVVVNWGHAIFAYSADGINWTETNDGLSNTKWRSLCYGNGKFVATSWNNIIAYSADGINWTEITSNLSNKDWFSSCYGNGKFVIISGGYNRSSTFAYSADGINWTEITNNTYNYTWKCICYGLDKFIAVNDDSGIFIYGSLEIPTDLAFKLFSATTSSTSFNQIIDHPTTLESYGITDGVNKSEIDKIKDSISLTLENLQFVPKGLDNVSIGANDLYIGIDIKKNDNKLVSYTSLLDIIVNRPQDGGDICKYAVLKNSEFKVLENNKGLNKRVWQSICYGNGKYVAISSYLSNTFAYSEDGINWTETTNGLSKRSWSFICYGKDKYVAISYNNSNTFAYSTDGISWTETTNGLSSRSWYSICYGNDKYVAVASNSTAFAYSTDGISWTETTNGLNSRNWFSICYGNGKFIAIAYNSNTFAYSTDGINWTETTNGLVSRQWKSICYGNGKYVAIASNSNIFAYSTDGINWTETTNGLNSRNWFSICYGNGKFIAIAYNSNTFAYSTDGINWTETTNGLVSRQWKSICYGNGKYVAIAESNNIFENLYDVSISNTQPGYSHFPSNEKTTEVFSTLYATDSENPNWESTGEGARIKVDTSQNNIVYEQSHTINEKLVKVKIGYDTTKGLYFESSIEDAINGINEMYGALNDSKEPLNLILNDFLSLVKSQLPSSF